MNKKIISPNPNQPIDRVPAGQLPSTLAELTEAALSGNEHTLPAYFGIPCTDEYCSFDGDDE